ncbi:MAG: AlkZ-related protein [Pseudobdellovibrionaceae bacterium]
MSRLQKKAVQAINQRGLLLVYPIDNRPLPLSIWSDLYPGTKMRWEWDEDGDSRVADLWHLRAKLSSSSQVVYTKWYQNRATFFSRQAWAALYKLSRQWKPQKWIRESDEILDVLDSDSPLSTRQIKEAVNLQGKLLEGTYERALKPLWQHFDIVGFGEIEDSSFPSLAVGSSRVLFEDLIAESESLSEAQALQILEKFLPDKSLWRKFWNRISA